VNAVDTAANNTYLCAMPPNPQQAPIPIAYQCFAGHWLSIMAGEIVLFRPDAEGLQAHWFDRAWRLTPMSAATTAK
jgi:hypothetical protein